MEIVNFEDIKEEIIKQLKGRRIFPIIGSGMTSNSNSYNGHVPSGTSMKSHMIDVINEKTGTDKNELDSTNFSKIATYYHKLEDENMQKIYIKNNFTKVELSDVKKKFLDINWEYIYTLNLDDGIENNSEFNYVVTCNKTVDFKYLNDEKIVIKLHGDVHDYLKYNNTESKIFDYEQYSKSIQKNKSLLAKLSHDFTYNNVLFIGCSLDDELDLKSITSFSNNEESNRIARYFMTSDKPNLLKQIELESYGITHIVCNKDYDAIYSNIYDAYIESLMTSEDELTSYKNIRVKNCDKNYESNKEYLYFTKSIFDPKEKILNIPAFFIERDMTKSILEEMSESAVHLIYGPRVSGKSYLLVSLATKIIDRDVYYFDSRNALNKKTINKILREKNIVVIFDTKSIDKDSIYEILRSTDDIKENNNVVIFAINTSDKDIVSAINSSKNISSVKCYELKSRFSENEYKLINDKLSIVELPKFKFKKTIIDNLVNIQHEHEKKGIFVKKSPKIDTIQQIATLILYAVNEKLYTTDLINYDIVSENYIQVQNTEPLISEEHTLFFERNIINTSSSKYIINAKYWLYDFLGNYAKNQKNREVIVDAYKYIISHLLNLTDGNPFSISMDFIKFDVINEIFKTDYKGQLGLVKSIYEGLHDQLSSSAHYYHQRAKCYLWQSNHDDKSKADLEKGLRFASLAKQYLQVELDRKHNEKVEISMGHIEMTISFIYSKLYYISNEGKEKLLNDAIESVYIAITRTSNRKDFVYLENDKNKNDLKKLILEIPNLQDMITNENKKKYSTIYNIYSDIKII